MPADDSMDAPRIKIPSVLDTSNYFSSSSMFSKETGEDVLKEAMETSDVSIPKFHF